MKSRWNWNLGFRSVSIVNIASQRNKNKKSRSHSLTEIPFSRPFSAQILNITAKRHRPSSRSFHFYFKIFFFGKLSLYNGLLYFYPILVATKFLLGVWGFTPLQVLIIYFLRHGESSYRLWHFAWNSQHSPLLLAVESKVVSIWSFRQSWQDQAVSLCRLQGARLKTSSQNAWA